MKVSIRASDLAPAIAKLQELEAVTPLPPVVVFAVARTLRVLTEEYRTYAAALANVNNAHVRKVDGRPVPISALDFDLSLYDGFYDPKREYDAGRFVVFGRDKEAAYYISLTDVPGGASPKDETRWAHFAPADLTSFHVEDASAYVEAVRALENAELEIDVYPFPLSLLSGYDHIPARMIWDPMVDPDK